MNELVHRRITDSPIAPTIAMSHCQQNTTRLLAPVRAESMRSTDNKELVDVAAGTPRISQGFIITD